MTLTPWIRECQPNREDHVVLESGRVRLLESAAHGVDVNTAALRVEVRAKPGVFRVDSQQP